MLMPPVSRYMTAQPWTIERDASLHDAAQLMRSHQIRHLPVLSSGTLVGLITDRDLQLIAARHGGDLAAAPVAEAILERPFIVTGDTALDEVAEIMAEHKYGSVIVMGRDGVEGIFTAVDACRVLAEVLQRASS
jgi:acetoin utilization protein AcuB